jgi:hypothetical protein
MRKYDEASMLEVEQSLDYMLQRKVSQPCAHFRKKILPEAACLEGSARRGRKSRERTLRISSIVHGGR